jgi:hypothetical protein
MAKASHVEGGSTATRHGWCRRGFVNEVKKEKEKETDELELFGLIQQLGLVDVEGEGEGEGVVARVDDRRQQNRNAKDYKRWHVTISLSLALTPPD